MIVGILADVLHVNRDIVYIVIYLLCKSLIFIDLEHVVSFV